MMSQTAPTATHPTSQQAPSSIKDNAFVAFYNDYDISELLYKQPAFESGFLPLEPEDDRQAHSHARVRPSEQTSNTASTTPPPAAGAVGDRSAALKKTAPQQQQGAASKARAVERRPSFIEVSTPKLYDEHEAAQKNGGRQMRRRHSSESHVPMSWWPEDETTAQLRWEERDCGSADEEEEIMEMEMWTDSFYDL
ncbi:hypothetical protein A1O1_03756 [Capronia coronata CBS 617.96]|uniref:Uncharacterized protein n=1 Tax=Capronia coronata CBS 617.96 TaxID=1182541 RepID=W9YCP0_9EURO|nr:uncharacterized protein A1O1_03756 [Capronia coronata CBS 617.96]EXJ90652.1 hypothetical protein A1O1_03756 [Capronia coronata CBS 617.96]